MKSHDRLTTLWYWEVLHLYIEVWAFIYNNGPFACLRDIESLDFGVCHLGVYVQMEEDEGAWNDCNSQSWLQGKKQLHVSKGLVAIDPLCPPLPLFLA